MSETARAKTIRSALGVLQEEPDDAVVWDQLRGAIGFTRAEDGPGRVDSGEVPRETLVELLSAARAAHEARCEFEAVAHLLEIEVALADGDARVARLRELAKVLDEELLDDEGARSVHLAILALVPDDAAVTDTMELRGAARGRWEELVARYESEAAGSDDAAFKSSLLVAAAEIELRYGQGHAEPSRVLARLRQALAFDPKNRRATHVLERLLGHLGKWDELAALLENYADEAPAREERLFAIVRLARILKKKIGAADRAATAYERVLDIAPGHGEATRALVDYFTERQRWDHLVSLYDGQLQGGGVRSGEELGGNLQVAMIHWRMRGRPEAAEPYFERVRRWEPAHAGMLGFFREFCRARNDAQRLLLVLSDAQRALPEGAERARLAGEIAQLAEESANAQKAIEQWRNVFRADPGNVEARDALKRLYRQTGAFNHLADVLRSELERLPAEDVETRLLRLREIAQIYRDQLKSDSALVTVLSQIIALDPTDASAVRELARVYETLGRWRDLLTTQVRLAELEPEVPVKAELYRLIARRWLDQFSNVQNAVEAYEKLRQAKPEDAEASEKLKELYTKRRSYRQLFELHESEAERASGAERRALWNEMARVASEKLDRGADAARLYKQILAEDPNDAAALDALEKQAERDKDFRTVAEALEKRAELAREDAARLVILQKLGGVYAERLNDAAGALRTWRRVLDLSPGHAKATRILRDSYVSLGDYDGLTELYAQTSDWDGLVEVLSGAADRVSDPEVKVELSFRAAEVYEERLNAPERAFRAYERVLSVRPNDRRAAAALVPLYESEEKWARLPALYEVLLSHAKDDVERRGLSRKLASVSGTRLADRASAFRHAQRAYELAPTDPQALSELESFAKSSGEWAAFTRTLEGRVNEGSVSVAERRALRLKLAESYAGNANKPDDAIRVYRELLAQNHDDEEVIAALDRLLRTNPSYREDLRWLFRLRVSRAADRERAALLGEWALLEEEALESPNAAADLYRELLEIEPSERRALRALSRILVGLGDPEGAAEVLQRERDLEEGETRVLRELDLARLYISPLKKPHEALAAAKRALDVTPNDARVVALLEELLQISETRATSALLLEEAYRASGQWAKEADILGVLLATAPSKRDRLALHQRLADAKQKLGDNVGAFDVVARAVAENPAELELWDRLAVLANKTSRTAQFVEAISAALPPTGESGLAPSVEVDLAERAATLYDEMLGDIDRATPYLERVLARDPGNLRAFARLKQILTTRERWTELEALYERVVAATQDVGRRTELLADVAIIAEEITGDANRAIRYYERILELEPLHEGSIFALDKLYAAAERWQNLADLLARRLHLSNPANALTLKLRLGTLLFTRLGDPKNALGYLEEVVSADSSVREARELIEKCLTHPDLRLRAAIVLEGVYVEREEMRDLVRVLEVRLEFVEGEAERRELLRRIAELRDERLTDDKGALETYARLLPIAPGDVEARQRYLEIATRQGRLSEAAEVLLTAAKNAEPPQPRAELLAEVAKILVELGDLERAEAVHRQVLELGTDDPSIALPAARALERLYEGRADKARALADALRVQIRLEQASELRRELLGRLAVLCEAALSDDAAAIVAWKERTEIDPTDEQALAALDRLYERTADHRALVDVLRAREERAEESGTRKQLMLRTAEALAEKLGDVPEAILAYRAVLDDFGADRAVHASLAALYEKAGQWRDLAAIIEDDLAASDDVADRVTLLTRLGDVRRERLGDVVESVEAYREALTLDPSSAAPRAALEELLEDENVRRDVAEILRPLYETSGPDAKLARVLDIQLGFEEGIDGRLDLLTRAADVAETGLADVPRAFVHTARALREGVREPSLPAWLERAERLAEKGGNWAELVQVYRDIVPDIEDQDRQVELSLRISEIARGKLADAALAKQYYRRVLDARPDDTRALTALEALHEEAAEYEQLLEILGRRADVAPTSPDKLAVLYKKARICEGSLRDRDRAIAAYEEILELGFEGPAVASLDALYTASGRWGDLVGLYERELQVPETSRPRRAELHHALGRVYERELGDLDRAFESYGEALREEPTHDATIASLENLMTQPAHAGQAASMLEAVYLARLDWRKVMTAIEARLSGSDDPDERRALLRRLAKLHEEQEENYRAALEVFAKLLALDVTDEGTWAELERLARVANAEDRLAEILASELAKITDDEEATARLAFRTGELYEALSDDARALSFYRRAYRFSPEEQQVAFAAIDRVLARTRQAAERVALHRESLEYRSETDARVATLHTVAAIEEGELADDDAAIATLRAIVDLDESDGRAPDALVRLYTRKQRFRDLAELHRRRAEQSALPEEEAAFRLALAKVLEGPLSDRGAAIDEYEAILLLVPPDSGEVGPASVAALEGFLDAPSSKSRVVEILRPLYERLDDWRKLIDLSKHRFTVADAVHEKVAVLRDTASLLEQRGHDVERAFDCLKEAFILDPDDGDTREELDRLAVVTERWDSLADAYEQAILRIDGVGQRELLEALARLHDSRRDDPRKALDAWDRLFQLDESDERPLDEMDQLATLLSDWPTLVRVLVRRTELTPDEETRASLWRRIGEARRDMLDDLPGAIDAYERALELEPESTFTLDNLIEALETRGDAARLVELYRRRIELCGEDDEELRQRLLLDAAKAYEEGLGDRREAVQLLAVALAARPLDKVVLERLAALYQAEKMWPELLDNLRTQASAETDGARRAELSKRIGKLLTAELDEHEKAIVAFQEVLAFGWDDEAARAIQSIGDSHDELRGQAADILEPLLTARTSQGIGDVKGESELLVQVLGMRLRSESEGPARAALRKRMADIAERALGDLALAESTLLAALADDPTDEALHQSAARLAALSGKEGWSRYADTLSERAASSFDAKVSAELSFRLGTVAEEQLGDLPRASEAFARSAEQGGDNASVLAALERLYGSLSDPRGLANVLERRMTLASDPIAVAELHWRLAALQAGPLDDKALALSTLRLALENVPDHEPSRLEVERFLADETLFEDAFATLEAAYRATGRGAELGALYERRVGRADGVRARTAARLELARVLESEAADVPGAQAAVEAALQEEPEDADVLANLERLAEQGGRWPSAAAAYQRALEALGEGASAESWARLAAWRRDRTLEPEAAERAYGRALARDAENVTLVRALEALQHAPGRERDRVETLRRLRRLEGEPEAKRALSQRATEIAEVVLGDAALAETILRELLSDNEADVWALTELTRLREAAGDHAEVLSLLLRRADAEMDAEIAIGLRHRAADVASASLGDKARATALYEAIIEQEPSDERAQQALRALYGELERYDALARLLRLLVENAESAEVRAERSLDLARLQREKFDAPDDAADTLRAVLEEDPDHPGALDALAALHESRARFAELAELWTGRMTRARSRGDERAELDAAVRLGTIYEEQIEDTAAALKAYEGVLSRDPSHRGALAAVARLAEGRGAWDKAAAALSALLEGGAPDDDVVTLASRLATAKLAQNDEAGAASALRRALAVSPRDKDVRARLATILEKTGSHAELAELLVGDADILRDESPAYEAPAPVVRASSPGGSVPPGPGASVPPPPPEVAEQVKLLRRAAEIHLRDRRSPEDALPILERITALVPQDREALLLLCDAYSAASKEHDAAAVLERVIASFGNRRTKELSLYHHKLGRAKAKLGDKDVALAQLDMAFKINPGSIEVLRDLGVLALEVSDLERAQKTFQALLLQRLDAASGITKGEVFCYLGEVNMKQGNKAKALQMLERAVESEPSLERAKTMLASIKAS